VQLHHVVVLVLVQWHHARVIAAALVVRSEYPRLSQIEKLISDSPVVCQSSKPHAFTRVAHALRFGGQWWRAPNVRFRREQQHWPLMRLETI